MVATVQDWPTQTTNAPRGITDNPAAQFRLHVVPPFPGAHVPPGIWPMGVPMESVASHGFRPAHEGHVLCSGAKGDPGHSASGHAFVQPNPQKKALDALSTAECVHDAASFEHVAVQLLQDWPLLHGICGANHRAHPV